MGKVIALSLFLLGGLLLPSPVQAAPTGGIGTDPEPGKVTRASLRAGFALAPKKAPARVKRAIRAANMIAKKPYLWAGGHQPWFGGARGYIKRSRGFDCSGSISFVLGAFGGRWLKSPLSSSAFLSWGKSGRGRWLTVYTGASHAYLLIAGLRFDTSGLSERGTRWTSVKRGMSGLKPRRLP